MQHSRFDETSETSFGLASEATPEVQMIDEKVDMVIDAMRTTTSDNVDVIIEPLDFNQGILRIKYYEGTNEDCPECVMQPDSFREMVKMMCKVQAPYVTDVEIEPAK